MWWILSQFLAQQESRWFSIWNRNRRPFNWCQLGQTMTWPSYFCAALLCVVKHKDSSTFTPTCTNSPSEDPGPSGNCCFYQALSKHLLEFGLQVKVLQASMHRDQQGGQLQLPFFHHQMQKVIGLGIIGHTDILMINKEERRENY